MSQLVTIDDLSTYMVGTTPDPGLGQIIVDSINSWVETQTGRCWGETKQVTERYDWQTILWLRHQDVVSVDEVAVGLPNQTMSVLDPTGYISNEFGRLTIFSWSTSRLNQSPLLNDYLRVKYTYGVTAVPDDLKMAVLGVAGGMYYWAVNGNRDTASVSVGSYRIEYTNKRPSGGAPDAATSTADANFNIIKSYKLRRQ